MLVVDASVALKWVLDEPGDLEARQLIASGQPLIAPELIVAEVANVAWRRLRMGQIPLSQARLINREVPEVLSILFPLFNLSERALTMAAELNHPVYDCFYLALAERENASMVTADRRFHIGLEGTHWAGLCRWLGRE